MTEAYELFDQILNSGASSETLYILIAKIKDEGDNEKVIEYCSKALQQYPVNIPLRRMLVEALFSENFLNQAQAEAEEVIRNLDPFIPIYKLLAKIHLKQERRALGLNILKKYLNFQPADPEAQALLRELAFEKEEPEMPPAAAVEKPRPQPADEWQGIPLKETPPPTQQPAEQPLSKMKETAGKEIYSSADVESADPFETAVARPETQPREKVDLSELIEKNDMSAETADRGRDREDDEKMLLESMKETGMSETIEEKIQMEQSFEPEQATASRTLETEAAQPDLDEDEFAEELPEAQPGPAPESPPLKTESPATEAEPPEQGPQPDDDFYYFSASEPDDMDDLPEIATPTLAEIYFNQGLVQEAVSTYEKLVLKNPQDRRSYQRLQEIKADAPALAASQTKTKEKNKKKKEKLISVLDDWLGKIRKLSK